MAISFSTLPIYTLPSARLRCHDNGKDKGAIGGQCVENEHLPRCRADGENDAVEHEGGVQKCKGHTVHKCAGLGRGWGDGGDGRGVRSGAAVGSF